MDTITKIIYSLEQIEVRGKKNIDILLGCILALENLRDELLKKEEEKNG